MTASGAYSFSQRQQRAYNTTSCLEVRPGDACYNAIKGVRAGSLSPPEALQVAESVTALAVTHTSRRVHNCSYILSKQVKETC